MRLAVVPARGGSKRIPRKNLVSFNGAPLMVWTIRAAIDTGLFDRVLVSTDDREIADVAVRFGADVPFLRAGTLADDYTPVSEVTADVLERLAAEGESYDVVVQLLPSCPLRTAEHVVASYDTFAAAAAEFQLSACRYGWLNPWWGFRLSPDGSPVALFPDALVSRSQDLPPLYCPTGAVWIAKTQPLLRERTFYGPGFRLAPLEWRAGVDIDEPDDLEFAQAVSALRTMQQPAAPHGSSVA